MWYIYGLRCSDHSLYIGSTNDLRRRLEEHQSGKSLSIRGRLPVKVAFYIAVPTESQARKLERYLKTGSGRAVMKKRILPDEAST